MGPREIADALGGVKTLGTSVRSAEDLIRTIHNGLPYTSYEAVRDRFALGDSRALMTVLDVPTRTLARRKHNRRLGPGESDRLARVGRIAAVATATLGSEEKAGRWLQKPNRALGGAAPLEYLATDIGAAQIEQLLGRIAHGVYS